VTSETAVGSEDGKLVPLRAINAGTGPALDATAPPAYADTTAENAGKPVPLIPEHLRRHNIRATARRVAGLQAHRTAYHGLRAPGYGVRTVFYAALGALSLTGRLVAWWGWFDGKVLESQAVAAGRAGHADAMRAHTEGKKTRATRGKTVGLCAVLALAVVLALVQWLPVWGWAALGLAAVLVLARHGKPAGRSLVHPAVVPPEFEKLTPDIIIRALGSLALAGIDKVLREGREIVFVSPVTRDGPGWRVEIDLPYGVTVTEIVERREKLASGLRRPVTCVWPEPASDEHAGRLVLYVSDLPLRKLRQPAYPLSRGGKVSLFDPLPFGTDQRGRAVSFLLMFANLLIGSIPRMGKTVALRIVLLFCALDVLAELHVWELKGTGDCGPLEKVAHAYGSGADDGTLMACLADTRKMYAELDRRAKTIRDLPRDRCPESKITPELAADRRLRLHPVVLAVDEVQEAFASEYRDEFEKYFLALIKRGPALGIMLVLATQRPDTKSLPTAISANVGMRFCLRVMDQVANDMVLGTSAYKRGINATLLALSDKGCGWAVGFADEPQVARTYNVDGPAAERICDLARAARQAAGRLTGRAAGELADAAAPRSFAADVLSVFDADRRLWSETIATRLRERIPSAYADITQDAVASQLRALGVTVKDVREAGKPPRKGCERAALEALAEPADA
jgi:S-DNA-T family DNA segregation ATPase FtsK/SpoIIIE